MLLKACVNGPRATFEHPAVALEPFELALDAAAAVAAGAGALHIHPKNSAGEDSLQADDVAKWLNIFRNACPGTPLGVTTGAWTAPDAATRVKLISAWDTHPDFASVNWHEEGADEVAEVLAGLGIGIEAGIWHSAGARQWALSPLREKCMRILIEIRDIPTAGVRTEAESLLELVTQCSGRIPILLHGMERSVWEAIRLAAQWGLDTRIGLEDTLLMPTGKRAADNAELVHAAWSIMLAARAPS